MDCTNITAKYSHASSAVDDTTSSNVGSVKKHTNSKSQLPATFLETNHIFDNHLDINSRAISIVNQHAINTESDIATEIKSTVTLTEAENNYFLALLRNRDKHAFKITDTETIKSIAFHSYNKYLKIYLLDEEDIIALINKQPKYINTLHNILIFDLGEGIRDKLENIAIRYYRSNPELCVFITGKNCTEDIAKTIMTTIAIKDFLNHKINHPKLAFTKELCIAYCKNKYAYVPLFKHTLPSYLQIDVQLAKIAVQNNPENMLYLSKEIATVSNSFMKEIIDSCFEFDNAIIKHDKDLKIYSKIWNKYPEFITEEHIKKTIAYVEKIDFSKIPSKYITADLCIEVIKNKNKIKKLTVLMLNKRLFSKIELLNLISNYYQKIGKDAIIAISQADSNIIKLDDIDKILLKKIILRIDYRLLHKVPALAKIFPQLEEEMQQDYLLCWAALYQKLPTLPSIEKAEALVPYIYNSIVHYPSTGWILEIVKEYSTVFNPILLDKSASQHAQVKHIIFESFSSCSLSKLYILNSVYKIDQWPKELVIELLHHIPMSKSNFLYYPIDLISNIFLNVESKTPDFIAVIIDKLTFFSGLSLQYFEEIMLTKKFNDEIKLAVFSNLINGKINFVVNDSLKSGYDNCHPLSFKIFSHCSIAILSACYQRAQTGKVGNNTLIALNQYMQNYQLTIITENVVPIINLLQTAKLNFCGGRTLQIATTNNSFDNYKFQRVNESLSDFSREAMFLDFLHYTPEGKALKAQLQSDIPKIKYACDIPYNQLQHIVTKFDDQVATYEVNGEKFLRILCFESSVNYAKYAHQLDNSNPNNPYNAATTGIAKAMHDLAVFARYEILFPEILPAFHDRDSSRGWVWLPALLGYPTLSATGCFGAWNASATARPDIGYGGLRDLGDFCTNGIDQTNYLKNINNQGMDNYFMQIDSVRQQIFIANSLGEYIIAATLIVARLYAQSLDYHYRNADSVAKTQEFIINTLAVIYCGYYAETSCDVKKLAGFMKISEDDLQLAIYNATREIIYFTAQQPTYINDEPQLEGYSEQEEKNLIDSFSMHLNNNYKLSTDLYTDSGTIFKSARYPENFTNYAGEISLGKGNGSFPLVLLGDMIGKFVCEIINNPPK